MNKRFSPIIRLDLDQSTDCLAERLEYWIFAVEIFLLALQEHSFRIQIEDKSNGEDYCYCRNEVNVKLADVNHRNHNIYYAFQHFYQSHPERTIKYT